jgi:hypothetical protein
VGDAKGVDCRHIDLRCPQALEQFGNGADSLVPLHEKATFGADHFPLGLLRGLLISASDTIFFSDRRVMRIESGDRAIDPLYPSWLWMGSPFFDFDRDSAWRILQEPRYSRLVVALKNVWRTAPSRPPLARALMQADLWSVYDMLHAMTRLRRGTWSGDNLERVRRAQALQPLVATTMRALALSSGEIVRLPNTYSAAAMALGLPDLLGDRTDWMEIRWFPLRSHDEAAGHRRAARVFFRPANRPNDEAAFLNMST